MIKQFLSFSSFSLILLLASCQKESLSKPNQNPNTISESRLSSATGISYSAADSVSTWYGSYAGYYGPYPAVAEADFIKDGYAKDPGINQSFSYSNISYDIPKAYNIPGDSIIFEVVTKNPSSSGFYNYDIVLQVMGEEHSAELHFVASSESQVYGQYLVGDKRISDMPRLVQSFETYRTIRLAFSKNATAATVDNNFIYGFSYGKANRIGRLKTINVAGKGFAYVDNVRLLSSKDYKPILSENFNTDGKSNTIFY